MIICDRCGNRFTSAGWVCPRCGGAPPVVSGFPSFTKRLTAAGESFSPDQFLGLFEIESHSFWFRHRAKLILGAMEFHSPEGKDIHEFGCGTGFVLSEVRRLRPWARLSGSDLFAEALGFACARVPEASFSLMDVCTSPFVEEFNIVLALDVLEHVEDDAQALSRIFRSLKPGGALIVTVPQHKWLWSRQDEMACHRRRYARRELLGRMERSGFRVVRVTSFVTLLLPLMALSRLYGQLTSKNRGEYDPIRELKIHPKANCLLSLVCSLERFVLWTGVALPFGGSLLCIGIKEA